MRIEFSRSGGFVGRTIRTVIDTNHLPEEESRTVREELSSVDFFQLPDRITSNQSGADQFVYQITVDDGEREHTVLISDAAAPEALQPLLRRLTVLARSRPSTQRRQDD
ncbi:MAG: hypothetical protein GYA17_16315 [Chloroflexi bacterium]|nr:protealysin inhibitor emfourin [Anaerolineaceae bacterium]NMB89923.1 hypothetical protein [Chloroflexota bacterium]